MTDKPTVAVGYAYATSPHAAKLNKGQACYLVCNMRGDALHGPFETVYRADDKVLELLASGDFDRSPYCKGHEIYYRGKRMDSHQLLRP